MNLSKLSPTLVGFLQSLGVAIYCSLVALFFWSMGNNLDEPPQILGMAMMLFLLVFSASVCGTLVFGYPVYLMMGQNIKRALQILAYTMVFSVLIFGLILLLIIL